MVMLNTTNLEGDGPLSENSQRQIRTGRLSIAISGPARITDRNNTAPKMHSMWPAKRYAQDFMVRLGAWRNVWMSILSVPFVAENTTTAFAGRSVVAVG